MPNISITNASNITELYIENPTRNSNKRLGGTLDLREFTSLKKFTCIKQDIEHFEINFSALPDLLVFEIPDNELDMEFPNLSNNTKLETINFQTNRDLYGRLPSVDNLTNLKNLVCARCDLSGNIPSFENNSKLDKVQLEHNSLSGFDGSFAQINKLQKFTVQGNDLTQTAVDNILNGILNGNVTAKTGAEINVGEELIENPNERNSIPSSNVINSVIPELRLSGFTVTYRTSELDSE